MKLSQKDFENYRIAIVDEAKTYYLDEQNIEEVNLKDHFRHQNDEHRAAYDRERRYIGLDHFNKEFKKATTNSEKAIRIYN